LSGVPDFGCASETIVLVDVSADAETMCDVSLDLIRSDVSDPRADDGEVSLPSSTELVGFSGSRVAGSDVGGLTVESECCGSSADVHPEELEDVFDRSRDFAGSGVAPEGDGPDFFTEFGPAAGPESVDPVLADELPEDAD
jgi:hypothetical protein